MASPFKRPRAVRELGNRVWDHLFVPETDESTDQAQLAQDVVAWVERPYHKIFMTWLKDQADRPVPLGDHITMVAGATRSNTLKEVHKHLLDIEEKARTALEALDD